MKRLLIVILVLVCSCSFAQIRGGAQYDPAAARRDLSNVSGAASLELSQRVRAAWAEITGNIYASGSARLEAGTAAAPAYSFAADPDTGIYSAGADTIGFVEGGVEAFRVNDDGEVLIATSTDAGDYKWQVNGNAYVAGRFYPKDIIRNGWARVASGTFETSDYFSLTAGASKNIDLTVLSSVGVACIVEATMQFTTSKQAFGVWHSTFQYNASTGLSGLVQQQTVDLDDSQLLGVAWSQPAANTLRVTFTNNHTATLYDITASIKIISRRGGEVSR